MMEERSVDQMILWAIGFLMMKYSGFPKNPFYLYIPHDMFEFPRVVLL